MHADTTKVSHVAEQLLRRMHTMKPEDRLHFCNKNIQFKTVLSTHPANGQCDCESKRNRQ